jgi:hypothetical protein
MSCLASKLGYPRPRIRWFIKKESQNDSGLRIALTVWTRPSQPEISKQ